MNQLEEFERYFNNLMDEDEKSSFEERVREDPELKKEFSFYEEMYEALKNEEAINLRKKLKQAEKKYGRQKGSGRRFLPGKNKLLLAATLIILAGIVSLILFFRGDPLLFYSGNYIAWEPGNEVSKEFILPQAYFLFREKEVKEGGLNVTAPPDSSLFSPGRKIRFRWDENIKKNMAFILSNWQDSIVHLEGVKGHGFRINSVLDRGIYYYRIMNNDSLIKLGVFIVDDQ